MPTLTRRRCLLLLLPSLRLQSTAAAIAKRLASRGEAQDREAEERCSPSFRRSIRIWYPAEEEDPRPHLRRQGCTAAAPVPTIRARLCSADADRLRYTSQPKTPSRSVAAPAATVVDLERRRISSRRRCRTTITEEGTAAALLRTRTPSRLRNPTRPSLRILILIRIRTRSRLTMRQAACQPVGPPLRPVFHPDLYKHHHLPPRPSPARQAGPRRRADIRP